MAGLIIEVVEGEDAGRKLTIREPTRVGRAPDNEFVLSDEQVSGRHLALYPSDQGGLEVRDFGSTNGTYVNDQPLQGPRLVTAGDRIRTGLTVLEVRTEKQVAAQPSAIGARPDITSLGKGVLKPASDAELADIAPVAAPAAAAPPQSPAAPSTPALLIDEAEPAFIPRNLAEGTDADDSGALGHLVDTRVRRQTNVAAFALLAVAGLLLIIYFGVIA
ncbi:MAG: FHA domain-containing protein [Solirubrobacterales bacterium]